MAACREWWGMVPHPAVSAHELCPLGPVLFSVCPAGVGKGMQGTLSNNLVMTPVWVGVLIFWRLGQLWRQM